MTPTAVPDRLRSEDVQAKVAELDRRIEARFPERGLRGAAADLVALVDQVDRAADLNRTRIRTARTVSRVLVVLVAVGTALTVGVAARSVYEDGVERGADWLPLVETTVNDLVFAAIAIFFLYSIPERMQRGAFLDLLHKLRSLAHVIDMHQLDKDPERLRHDYTATEVSPELDLDADGLEHYLDHCSELLSLVAKTAALCAEESRDPLVLDTVGGIETLTTGMSRKIWQKITVLNSIR